MCLGCADQLLCWAVIACRARSCCCGEWGAPPWNALKVGQRGLGCCGVPGVEGACCWDGGCLPLWLVFMEGNATRLQSKLCYLNPTRWLGRMVVHGGRAETSWRLWPSHGLHLDTAASNLQGQEEPQLEGCGSGELLQGPWFLLAFFPIITALLLPGVFAAC